MKWNKNRAKRKDHTNEIVLKRMQLYFNSCNTIAKNEKETQTISKIVYLHSEATRYITTKLEIMKNDGVFENLLTKMEYSNRSICYSIHI